MPCSRRHVLECSEKLPIVLKVLIVPGSTFFIYNALNFGWAEFTDGLGDPPRLRFVVEGTMVPEPTTLSLAIVFLLGIVIRRRRSQEPSSDAAGGRERHSQPR